jgi:hypothetical protein
MRTKPTPVRSRCHWEGQWHEQRRVKFIRSYFSKDRRRMICEYEAPDAEAVREVQRTASMPFERIWAAEVFDWEES